MHNNPLLFIVWVLMAAMAVLSLLHEPSIFDAINHFWSQLNVRKLK